MGGFSVGGVVVVVLKTPLARLTIFSLLRRISFRRNSHALYWRAGVARGGGRSVSGSPGVCVAVAVGRRVERERGGGGRQVTLHRRSVARHRQGSQRKQVL